MVWFLSVNLEQDYWYMGRCRRLSENSVFLLIILLMAGSNSFLKMFRVIFSIEFKFFFINE